MSWTDPLLQQLQDCSVLRFELLHLCGASGVGTLELLHKDHVGGDSTAQVIAGAQVVRDYEVRLELVVERGIQEQSTTVQSCWCEGHVLFNPLVMMYDGRQAVSQYALQVGDSGPGGEERSNGSRDIRSGLQRDGTDSEFGRVLGQSSQDPPEHLVTVRRVLGVRHHVAHAPVAANCDGEVRCGVC